MPRCVTCGQRWEGTHAHCPRGATPTNAPSTGRGRPSPSLELAGYRLEEEVARGGFGTLYSARREHDGARVAIKVAHAEVPLARAQLARETEVLRVIGPPTVPSVHDTGTLPNGAPYLVMQFIASPTLAQRMAQVSGPMPLAEFTSRTQALLDALAVVHGHGYLHGDLKPENVFLDDATRSAGFFDFGLARSVSTAIHSSADEPTPPIGDSFAGTVEYMSPEQCSSQSGLDIRSDIYSLGVLLYEMLTGRPPFFGTPADVIHAHLARRPLRPSELVPVPAALEQVVLRCLTKERERRYESVAALRLALLEALASTEKPSTPLPHAREKAAPTPPAPVRRSVAVLFFRSGANPVTVQKALAGFGGQMASHEGTRFAGVFDPDAGENPVRRARQAAEGLAAQNLAPAALIDVATVTVQRRPGGPARYLGPIFARKDRYPTDDDPSTLLLTTAAAEALPDLPCEPVTGREGVFRRASASLGREDVTILQHGSGVLVGRGSELAELMESAGLALVEGAPTLVTVLGDRGHGKTHLSAALAQQLQVALPNARVATWRAREPVQGDPEGTLRMLLRGALYDFRGDAELTGSDHEGRATCFELLGPQLATELWPGVASTLGWLAPGAAGLQNWAAAPGALRSLAMRAAGELLAARARRRPLCLLLDDAQYAEETALDALEYAALAESRLPLWVCVLARPGFERLRPSWGTRAARRHVLPLGPLSPPSAVELCRTLLRPAENIPAAALEHLSERAQRVPLFLVELVRGLKRQGLVRQRASGGSWFLATDELDRMPELRLVDWLADRELGTLPVELAAHARLCALLGPDFTAAEAEGVVHALEEDGGAADFPLDPRHATRRLLDLGLLVSHRQEGLSFRNELLRATVERSLPEADRARIHRAAFRYYQSKAGAAERQRLPRLALHAAAAGLRDEAAALYIDLAESARGRHAYIEAESTYTRALELLEPDDRRRRLTVLRGRGLMRYRVGRYEDSLADFAAARELARQLEAVFDEVDLLLDEAMAYDWINDYARSKERVYAAQDLTFSRKLQSPLLQLRLLLGLGRAQFRDGQWEECCEPLREAAERARKLGDAGYESLVVAQLLLGVILPNIGHIDEAEHILEEVITECSERGDRLHLGSAINNRRNVWVARNDVQGAMQDQERFLHLGRELGMVGWEYFAEHNMGELLHQAGNAEGAAPHIIRAIELERHHPEMAPRPWALLLQARALAYLGQDEKTRVLLTEIRQTLKQSGAEFSPSEEVMFDAVDLATRDATDAEWEALLARSNEFSVEQEPLEVLELRGRALRRRGRRKEAVRILEEALRRAETIPNVMRDRLKRSLESARLVPEA
ncbi:serine/threonine-protein kinase PknK [Archangium violaceum]|uniref:Protein kinase n=1 Tax=Archangium violaceum Cb vi76 TaxID=1406225 RepID=A0A084SMJ2_9BACT|nr:serine/threonine-protein kinase [Archangium violaceum]KFA89677.1 protein kinase [Archangium violaceum Cb vi76]